MHTNLRRASAGFVSLAALMFLLLLTGISIGMFHVVNTETRLGETDLENTSAYYAAEAGMEKMMSDLNDVYAVQQSPSVANIQALGNAALQPALPSVSYPTYSFSIPNTGGVPDVEVRNISSGPNEGLMAYISPMTLDVTARRFGGAEVQMQRGIEVALIPVFQFGIFSDTDLSYFPGPDFDFGGRVHTNGNLFLATSSASGLVFHNKLTAVSEVIRAELSNGLGTVATGRTSPILIPTAPNGCDGAQPACRDLDENEGSKLGGPASADNPSWNSISTTTYNGMILDGDTGASALSLPFVSAGLRPIELIRRPPPGESDTSLMYLSRLYGQAQIRVLLTDDPAELPGGAGDPENIRLANVAPYATGVPVPGATPTYFAEGNQGVDGNWVRPAGVPVGGSWPLIDGYLRVEHRRLDGSFAGVTREWLELGFARGLLTPNSEVGQANTVHPNAILILQMQADRNADGDLTDGDESTTVTGAGARNNWFPINLYDAREGEVRDVSLGASNHGSAIGGIMNVVDLDVGNLRRWLLGNIGATGMQTENTTQNGYILYFSDRRGMLTNPAGDQVGEYGYEDMINPPVANGNPDGVLHPAEDVNANGQLEVYGRANLGDGFLTAAQGADTASDSPITRIDGLTVGRKNRVSGARHGLKLVNGTLGNVPTRLDGTGGFTVASENIVYIMGNYNANNVGFGDPHTAAAAIADAVSFLSNNWRDVNSFDDATYVGVATSRIAVNSWYRVAVSAGKNISWPHPAWAGGAQDWGLDGGTHNFLRYLERWSGQSFNYRGSLVSLYYSEYAVGIYKCCSTVYTPPTRNYTFDTEFLDPSTLPPGTPRFRDVVNLGFRQIFSPD